MEARKIFKLAIGAVITLIGLAALGPGIVTGIAAIPALIIIAAGLLLMGYDGLANWLERLFDR